MPAALPRWQSPVVNKNITDCLAGLGRIPIVSQSYRPNLPTQFSHRNCPLFPPISVFPLLHLQCSPVTPLALSMPECQPNLFCCPPLYPLGFVFPITSQPPFTCPPLFQPSAGSLIPHWGKILSPLKPQFILNLCLLNLGSFGVSLFCPIALPFSLTSYISMSGWACPCFLCPSFPDHHLLSTLISLDSIPCFFCSYVCRFSGSVYFPRQPILGRLPSPSECSLGDMKPCQLPMSLLEHNTVRQADANTHTNTTCTFLHAHTHSKACT